MRWIQKNDGRVCSDRSVIEFDPITAEELEMLRLIQKCDRYALLDDDISDDAKRRKQICTRLEGLRYIRTTRLDGQKYANTYITCRGDIFLAELDYSNATRMD